MKNALFCLMIVLLLGHRLAEGAFNSGSTGVDGAFSPTINTHLQVPQNGIFNFTTVNIPSGVTVTLINNAANTPVYMLATGDVNIAGTISVNGGDGSFVMPGKGGPGGFDGGLGGAINTDGGKGLGPGGGNPATFYTSSTGGGGGGGGYATAGGNGQNGNAGFGGGTYGNVNIVPASGGSGGGGGAGMSTYTGKGGGGGAGAIVITSSGTITVNGSITANGGAGAAVSSGCSVSMPGAGGGGSGGAVRLVADKITGTGSIVSTGGAGGSGGGCGQTSGGNGGNGRIRFEANSVTGSIITDPVYVFGYPSTVFVANIPTLSITSVGGVSVPVNPSGRYGSPDITLPSTTTNPVTVAVSALNIPVGTTITVSSAPEYGSSTSATGILSGTIASSSTTAAITLSNQYPCILTATATFTVQTAMYYDGEKIEKVRVASTVGKGSEVTYISATGREIKLSQMLAQDRMR